MADVDLNPIRAKMESTPETSKHTSIQQCIQAVIQGKQASSQVRFVGNPRQSKPKYTPIDSR